MILSCHGISKSFGTDEIIRQASFGIEAHEKAAIVGINGAGKSTLLKILIGEIAADEGEVVISRGITIGYLAQQKMISGSRTIYEELKDAKKELAEMEQTLRSLEVRISEGGPGLEEHIAAYDRLMHRFEQENGYQLESEITGVLKGLGFTEDEFDKRTDTLSGGQKTRIALGRLLLSAPDIILLDEPTNHLDLNSIAWLENYLLNYRGAVLVVAHDRYFLNKVVSKVIEIDQGHVHTFKGNYSAYSEKKAEMRRQALRAWMNQQQEIRHQEEVITKLRSFNREKSIKRAESREKMLEKIVPVEKPADVSDRIRLTLTPHVISGKDVLRTEHLSHSFGAQQLFSDLNFQIYRGEHVALIGDNGTGKTTILKILNGILTPDQGSISYGSNVQIGYYDQDHQVLHPEKTLFDELSDAYPDMTQTQIRDVLAAFLFTGDDVFKRIQDISGGERGRVSLAKLMLSNANFLILDEPTNHLDIVSKEILEDALNNYSGTVLYVSHDRYFINQTASRILELTGGTLINYQGNYDYYLEKKEELTAIFAASAAETALAARTSTAKQERTARKEEESRKRRIAGQIERLEKEIAQLEDEDRRIDDQLVLEEVYTDPQRCLELTTRKAEIAETLEELYEKWAELA